MKEKGFNLITVIIIVLVTSLVSAFTTGLILNNNYKGISGLTYTDVMNDEELTEFLSVYSTIISSFYDEVDTTAMLNEVIDAMKGYKGDSKEELIKIATEAMVAYLGDDYTTILNSGESDELTDRLNGTYQGVGITIQQNLIKSVTKNSPAEKAGILAGDIIVNVNGIEINDTNSSSIGLLIQDENITSVKLTVNRNGQLLDFTMDKTTLDSSIVYEKIENTNIGYIKIDIFSKSVDEAFENALLTLEEQGISNLIIDMRDNTGGYLDKTVDIASLFLEKGKTIYSLEDKESNIVEKDTTEEKRDYEIVVLMNGESASASEILAAALIDSYGATYVGTKSFGKGSVQQTTNTDSGDLIKYTTAKWYTPNGICIDGVGINPHYVVELAYTYDEAGNITGVTDTQLNKAIEILGA